MNAVRLFFAELLGLFVDDGNLALLVLGLVAVVTGLVTLAGLGALAGAVMLLAGCCAILAFSVLRRARR